MPNYVTLRSRKNDISEQREAEILDLVKNKYNRNQKLVLIDIAESLGCSPQYVSRKISLMEKKNLIKTVSSGNRKYIFPV